MLSPKWPLLRCGGLLLAFALVAACGGSKSSAGPSSAPATSTPAPTTAAATTPAGPTSTGAVTPVAPTATAAAATAVNPTSTPTGNVNPQRPQDAATQAALAFFGAVKADSFDACRAQTKPCILVSPEEATPDRGVAAFEEASPEGGGALVVFGAEANGAWGFWFGTQQAVYHALKLPAEMRVCADGQGVNVRQQPDVTSAAVGQLAAGAVVTADRFILTDPVTAVLSPERGNGWYAVSGSVQGYIRADFLSATTLPDCSLRDALTP